MAQVSTKIFEKFSFFKYQLLEIGVMLFFKRADLFSGFVLFTFKIELGRLRELDPTGSLASPTSTYRKGTGYM